MDNKDDSSDDLFPESHPRHLSHKIRLKLVSGVERGITSLYGLTAHGRGEAFDYLLGEKTHDFAKVAINKAAELLVSAQHPVISVNGNAAALSPEGMVSLSNALGIPLEVNLFHTSAQRERDIKTHLKEYGAANVLLPDSRCALIGLDSNRRFVNPEGIFTADVVFVPLEDGDRCQALIQNGKKVIVVDLNPSSRSALSATVTIVDHLCRALPLLTDAVLLAKENKLSAANYVHENILSAARQAIVSEFSSPLSSAAAKSKRKD